MADYYITFSYDSDNVDDILQESPARLPQMRAILLDGPNFHPRQQDLSKGAEALAILTKALLGEDIRIEESTELPGLQLHYAVSNSMVTLGLIPLSTFAWGLWYPKDIISVSALGSPSPETFFELACARLRAHKNLITIEGFNRLEASFELSISSVKVHLTYHKNPMILRWQGVNERVLIEAKQSFLSASATQVDDLIKTSQTVRGMKAAGVEYVHRAYWNYLTWSENLGLSPIILDREHILCLAKYSLDTEITSAALKQLELPVPNSEAGIGLVANHFGFHWNSIKSWRLEVIAKVTRNTDLMILKDIENTNASKDFSISQWPRFFAAWPHYIQVHVSFWGSSSVGAARWFSVIEKTIKSERFDRMEDALNAMQYQFWPQPFEEHEDRPWMSMSRGNTSLAAQKPNKIEAIALKAVQDAPHFETTPGQKHIQVSYFIGYESAHPSEPKIYEAIDSLNARLREALAGKDRSSGSYHICKVRAMDIKPTWYPYVLNLVPIPADLRELGVDEDEGTAARAEQEEAEKVKTEAAKDDTGKEEDVDGNMDERNFCPTEKLTSTARLRPATDILNRLRHDDAYDIDDFLVGYLDRFRGPVEVPASTWTTEATAYDFIPQSRIVYFKRVSNGQIIWHREQRVDLVFRSH